MPAPINIDSAHAIDIGDLSSPYSTTQDVFFAGTTYPVWYKFTALSNGTLRLYPFGYEDASSCQTTLVYRPFARTFSPDAVTQYIVTESWNTTLFIPVYSGITYYFQISPVPFGNPPANPSPAILTLKANLFALSLPASIGSYLIPPDTVGFPASFVDKTTGVVKQLIDFPAGEGGAQLSDGKILVEDKSQQSTQQTIVKLYDSQVNLISTITWDTSSDGWYDSYIGSNKSNKFYVGYNSDFVNFSGNSSFRTISNAGVSSGWTELPVSGLLGLCPNNAETILYYTHSSGSNKQVKRWNIPGGAALSDLAANYVQGGNTYTPSDIIVLDDNTIIVVYEFSDGTYNDVYIVQYNSSGTILNTDHRGNDAVHPSVRINYNYATPTTFISYEHNIRTTGPVNCQGNPDGTITIKTIRSSDFVVTDSVSGVWTSAGKYVGPQSSTESDFGPSGSCPIFKLIAAYPSASNGTIIVNKTTDPDNIQSFTFIAGGGLSPSSFNLVSGGSQTILNVVPGSGYSIAETPVPGYSVSYVISNNSTIDNITVGAGETVTIDVTNTKIPALFSGIYKIVPGKTNDTLWVDLAEGSTQIVKIPDPFARTALVGS